MGRIQEETRPCWGGVGRSWLWSSGGTTNSYPVSGGHPQSSAFSKTTKTLAQKKRWENIRCRICLGLVVGFVLLIILIVLLAVFLPQTSKDNSVPQAQDTGIISRPGD